MKRLSAALWFILLLSCEALAFYLIKKHSIIKHDTKYLFFSISLYVLIPIFLSKLLKYDNKIGILNLLWSIISVIYALMIGVILFHEKVTHMQLLGAIMGFLSIGLIWYGGTH